ncbi:MAG TPA: dipeptide epimerase [Longimicrobiales bacterium]|nr:dipeptide epimerase [Longimicrobiales bacterium]
MRIELETLELRTRHDFHISRMPAPPIRRTVWVRLIDADGVEGWGEAPTSTPYYGETAETATEALRSIEGLVCDAFADATEDGDGAPGAVPPDAVDRRVAEALDGQPMARAGLSAALHDLFGKRRGEPLWRMWGLDPSAAPRSAYTIGLDAVDAMRERAAESVDYPIIKVKVGTPEDEATLAAIRDARPDATLLVDANTAWTLEGAIDRLPMLEAYGVALIEQPLHPDDDESWEPLRRAAAIPIVADESCKDARDVERLAGRVDGINIKLAKCGSLGEARRMAEIARSHDMLVMLGCMVESTLGIAAGVQVAPLVDYCDLDGAALLAEDPFDGPGLEPDGSLRFNDEAGLGVRRRAG